MQREGEEWNRAGKKNEQQKVLREICSQCSLLQVSRRREEEFVDKAEIVCCFILHYDDTNGFIYMLKKERVWYADWSWSIQSVNMRHAALCQCSMRQMEEKESWTKEQETLCNSLRILQFLPPRTTPDNDEQMSNSWERRTRAILLIIFSFLSVISFRRILSCFALKPSLTRNSRGIPMMDWLQEENDVGEKSGSSGEPAVRMKKITLGMMNCGIDGWSMSQVTTHVLINIHDITSCKLLVDEGGMIGSFRSEMRFFVPTAEWSWW